MRLTRRRPHVLWGLAGGLLLALTWVLAKIGAWAGETNQPGSAGVKLWLTATYLVAGLLFVVTVWGLRHSKSSRGLLALIIVAGLAMRAVCFTEPARHETDFYRYMWEGALTANGHNPYSVRPKDAPHDDDLAALTEAGRPVLEHVTHSYLTSIYPPVAQAVFALAYRIAPFNANALRAVFLGFDVAVLAMLVLVLRRLGKPLHQAAFYWWNPIVVKEFYIAAHMDAVVIAFAFSAVVAVLWHWRRSGMMLLGVAMGAKLWPVVLAPILLRRQARSWRQWVAGALLLGATATVVLWPLLVSWQRGEQSGLYAYARQWRSNAGLFSVIRWASHSLRERNFFGWEAAENATRFVSAGLLAVWLVVLTRRPITDDEDFVRRCLFAVGGMFLLSPTQFPWYYTWLLPLLAVTPSLPLLLYTALLPLYHLHDEHKWVLWIEHLPVWALLIWSIRRRRLLPAAERFAPVASLPAGLRVAVIIPALNEEQAIGRVLEAIPQWVCQVIVADNGSTDHTGEVARERGATVVHQPERGYGAACLAGIAALNRPDIVVFLDADFSDHPQEMTRLVEPIARNEADLVIGSRVLGQAEPGALTPQQRFGNALACRLIRIIYGVRFSDLGPFRAIRYAALQRLEMSDRNFGWTVQMQVRAAQFGLWAVEVPVSYRQRVGQSKISGTVRGVILAGTKIISTIVLEARRAKRRQAAIDERLIVFARYPRAGKSKTRLAPLLGDEGAARLHRQLVVQTLHTARGFSALRDVAAEVRCTGDSPRAMAAMFGNDLTYRDQGDGDLGQRLHSATAAAFDESAQRVVVIGTDCPLLTRQHLDAAFEALANNDVVLGPAHDGGYYLIGLNRAHEELFADIPWGGPEALTRTQRAAERLGLRVHLLPELPDVDTPADLATWAQGRMGQANEPPRLSVIIPARNEQEHLAATLGSVLACAGTEIIVVDGQSDDRTAEIARQFGVTVISAPPSRGGQLNAGAARARGDVLLFLHADTVLPADYAPQIRAVLDQPGTAAGAFEFQVDAPGLALRLIEWAVHWRSRLLGRPYGDQAMFMTTETFRECSGFPDLPYMEDYAMLARLRRQGRIRIAGSAVQTSARRWQEHGTWRTTLRHQWLIIRHAVRHPAKKGVQAALQLRKLAK
jgi:rSAM/selenodomain-associated transferase 2/rSAM/selenodomain-associated transferase 1